MRWELREGEAYRKAAPIFTETGRPLPEKWASRPVPPEHLNWVWSAFFELTHSRHIGMGIGGIPYEAVVIYSENNLLTEEEEFEMTYHLKQMDAEFLNSLKDG